MKRFIFGDAIKFDYRSGDEFMSAISNPKIRAVVALGSDRTFLRYEDAVRNVKKIQNKRPKLLSIETSVAGLGDTACTR